MLVFSIYTGGLLMFAYTATAILVLIHHEYAHVKECELRNVKINSVNFSWFGGTVHADICYAHDAVQILSAGVINTGCYALAFSVILATTLYVEGFFGKSLVGLEYIRFLNVLVLFSIIMVITNILPITYHSKEHGLISTDGWASLRFRELRDEMWNNGVVDALGHYKNEE